jgi:tetratricopeptide (TPR) repeat protein
MNRFPARTWLLLGALAAASALPAYASEEGGAAKSFYNRGTESYGKRDYEAAIRNLSEAIRLEPKAPDAYFNRGLSFRRLQRIDEAITDFTEAIRLYPDQQPAYYAERCNARIVNQDYDGAIADGTKEIAVSPDAAEGYFLRGLAHHLRGDLNEAFADVVQGLRIDPDYPHARRLLNEIAGPAASAPPVEFVPAFLPPARGVNPSHNEL